MSRSIHSTRQTLDKIRRQEHADPAAKATAVLRERRALSHKRSLKSQMRRESTDGRQEPALDQPPADVATLPIEVVTAGDPRFVHHAASPEDLRALLAVLPPGMGDGLSRIILTLGKRYIEGRDHEDWLEPDPLTGRVGGKLFRGVYDGAILGVYLIASASIHLHAYVYDPEDLPLPRPLCELYLRLQALVTFAHELAHHFDHTRRVARGRWLARGKQRVERYAEKCEHSWGREYVVPLLRHLYPEEVRGLEEWISRRGGLRVPLEWLVLAPSSGIVAGHGNATFDLRSAFETWLSDEDAPSSDSSTSRHDFAWALHYADEYEACLLAIEELLADFALTAKLWSFRADTLVHLERWDEAEVAARRALELDPKLSDAWEQLGWAAIGHRDWPGLLAITQRRQSLIDPAVDRVEWRNLMFQRAVALCGTGEFARMEACLAASVVCRARLASRRKGVYHWAGFGDQLRTSQS